ncbi:hypothetical protein HYALB_00000720 [Hymenoscyphus albidus]|uniref:Uncharacterized protein n=1 Tax=Hymenoscyphus albidus TaxID=595503 RepID=A0A9N9LMT8_9HELO|nr:hypothetical protein HYALB_00000720 [Hymenoscyphus albidus]
MSRHHYDPIPQRSNSIPPPPSSNTPYDPIILSPIPSTPSHSYNFNTGLATSIASHSHTSQTPSIPNSPPPSFHTFSSPGTPRPTPSTRTGMSASTGSGVAGPYGELWGVASSTVLGHGESGTSNDALATIAGLKLRVEWLEESIGRLLLEKEKEKECAGLGDGGNGRERDNCCISFTDASPDVERAIMASRSNCCVSFRRTGMGGGKGRGRERRRVFAFVVLVLGGGFVLGLIFLGGYHSVKREGFEVEGKA